MALPLFFPDVRYVKALDRRAAIPLDRLCARAGAPCKASGAWTQRPVIVRDAGQSPPWIHAEAGEWNAVEIGTPPLGSDVERARWALGALAFMLFDGVARASIAGQPWARIEHPDAMRTAHHLPGGGGARKKQDKLKDQRQDEKTDKDAKDDRLMHSDTVVSNQQDYAPASGSGAGAGAGGAGGAGAAGAAGGTAAAGAAAGATAGTSLVATKGSAIAQDVGGGQGAFTGHASGFKADNPMHDGASVASPHEGGDLHGDRDMSSGESGNSGSKAA